MDPKRISKKRKLPPAPSHPMIGICTRTRSQIRQSSSSHDDAELRCLIKDLRTRRVFSPKSIHADQNVGSVYMGSHGTVAAENMKDISTVLSSIDEESRFDKNPYNDESEEVDVNVQKGSSEKSDGDGEYVGLVKAVGEVNEESVQTTPPDGMVFDDGAVNENGGQIFSPKSIHADQNVDRVYMGSHGTAAAEDMKDISTVLSSIVEKSRLDKNAYNDENGEVDVNGQKGSSEKSDGDGEYVGLVEAVGEVNEESVQTTPPDGKVFDDGAVNENGGQIFSPKSIHADQNVDRVYMGSHGTVAAEDMKDISTVLSSIVEESRLDKNAYNDENGEVDVNGQKGSSEKSGGDGEHVGLVKAVGDLNEENVRTTPLDAKVFGDGEVSENEGKPSNGIFQRVDKCVGEALGANIDKKNHSISDTKLVLRPCFSKKLFKTPGSVSYKRLLPYLMDIAKDNSCTPKSSQCPKLDKGSGQLLPQPQFASKDQEVSMDKSNTGDSGNSPTSVLNSANESSNGNMADLSTCEHFPESSMTFDFKKSVDEHHDKKFDLGFSSEDHKNDSNPDLSLVLEDDAKGQSENGEIEKTDCGFSSEAQDVDEVKPQLSLIVDECHSGRDYGAGQQHSDYSKKSETGGMKKLNDGYPCQAQNLNPDVSEAEDSKSFSLEKRGGDDGKVQNQIDGSNEEFFQTTPPDAVIFAKPYIEENGGGRVEFVEKSTDHVLAKPLNGSDTRSVGCASDKRIYSNSKNKLVINPCSGVKLYKTPGSFSYRRLLPFLMDITKDKSCASENENCLKLEKDREQILLPPHVTSDCQEKLFDNSNGYQLHAECHTSNSGTLPMDELPVAHDLSNDDEPKLKCPRGISESTIPLDSQKELRLPVQYCQLETSPKKVSSVHEIDLPVTSLCPPVTCEALSREEGTISISRVSVNTEMDCPSSSIKYSDCTKPVEAECLSQNTSQLEVSVPSGVHVAGLKKGILKRNPRGCRGLCTCLNCASFRLHAERAFEFSKNQMQDAEEVALDLIKELSYLRTMLEKSTDGVNDHSIVHVNQVKEACRKASEAEELAKHRLYQMNDELNIHCRITCLQPPKVRFANYVEEKVLPNK